MFSIYSTPMSAIEFNNLLNRLILFIRKNEIGNTNIQIAAEAMLDKLYRNFDKNIDRNEI